MTTAEPALPDGYVELLEQLKHTVATARWHAQRTVNTELLQLYWRLGSTILLRQQQQSWGTRVIDRLATDLRAAFPDMRGLSRSNLFYMRAMAAAWSPEAIVQQPVGQLPWGHVTVLLDKLSEQQQRDWYAAGAVEHGWSRNVLIHQIATGLHRRLGAAPSNFAARLPAPDSELAQQLTRDPYVLDFLDLSDPVSERDLETALLSHVQQFLLELGTGFAFLGRQYHLKVDGDDFYIDLLFFHISQARYVVVELKIDRFRPEHTGQLGFYVAWVDDQLRDPTRHAPTVGILMCAGRNDSVVRYALANTRAPLAVADYTYESLPLALREALPSNEQLQAIATGSISLHGAPNAGPSPANASGTISLHGAASAGPSPADTTEQAPLHDTTGGSTSPDESTG